LTLRVSERLRDPAAVFPRRPSASFNDNFVDIGFFHQLSTNRIKARPAKRAWIEPIDMRSAYEKDPADPRYTPKHLDNADGRADLDKHHVVIDGGHLDGDCTAIPRIRDPRTNRNGRQISFENNMLSDRRFAAQLNPP
jgi:hypothetical protein